MPPLSTKRRSELRAEAHKLTPVVIIGDKGLTDSVVAEIDRSLTAHELIKVRASGGERDSRGAWLAAICERLRAHPIQQIGKVLVIYRENPAEERLPASGGARKDVRKTAVLTEDGKKRQRARDAEKRKQRDVEDMVRKGKIKPDATGTSRPRSRTPSPLPESAPPRRRPRTSR